MTPTAVPAGASVPRAAATNDRITLVSGTDDNLVPHLEVVAISILAQAKPDRPIDYHILYQGKGSAALDRLARFHYGPLRIIVHKVVNPLDDLGGLRHLTTGTFLRYVVPDYVTEAPRAAYIDSDIVVLEDIAELFDADLEGMPVGGMPDVAMWRFRDLGVVLKAADFTGTTDEYLARFIPNPTPERMDMYINGGIQLLDLDIWRREGLGQLAQRTLRDWNSRLLYRDQDTTNMLFFDRMKRLDPRWNALANMLATPLHKFQPGHRRDLARRQRTRPGLVHFTSLDKPWLRSAWLPYASHWWVMASFSQFYDQLRGGHRALMRKRRTIPLSLPGPLTYWRTREARQRLLDYGLPVRAPQ